MESDSVTELVSKRTRRKVQRGAYIDVEALTCTNYHTHQKTYQINEVIHSD